MMNVLYLNQDADKDFLPAHKRAMPHIVFE